MTKIEKICQNGKLYHFSFKLFQQPIIVLFDHALFVEYVFIINFAKSIGSGIDARAN